jgi:prephenate dehydrogenase
VTRAAVVGLGLIGGSAALGLGARGWDRDERARGRAQSQGIDVRDTVEEALEGAQVVLLAVPTQDVPALLSRCASIRPDALFSDCASLKAPVARAAAALPPAVRFVGGHPMAGPGSHGLAAADPTIFRGRPWILVPTPQSDEASIGILSELVSSLGAAPVILDADRHDAAMTRVSHLPHVVAAALALSAAGPGTGPAVGSLAGPGLLDTTRLAEMPPALLKELAMADPPALAAAVEEVAANLEKAAEALRRGDVSALDAFFREAGVARARIDGRRKTS